MALNALSGVLFHKGVYVRYQICTDFDAVAEKLATRGVDAAILERFELMSP